jgi:hypothetical protein
MMHLSRFLGATRQRATLLLAGMLFAGVAAAADPFPVKPVTMMVPYPAGGLSDVIARVVNTPLATRLGKPVVAVPSARKRYWARQPTAITCFRAPLTN